MDAPNDTRQTKIQRASAARSGRRAPPGGQVSVHVTNARRNRAWAAVVLLALVGAGTAAWWRGRPERHLAEAERRLAEGSWGSAGVWLELPERTAATRDRALILRARAAIQAGRPGDAVAPLRGVDPRGRCAAEADFWKGRALYAVGNTPLAIAWFRSALAARPADAETLRWLAAAAYDLGDQRTVMSALRSLTAVAPRDARAWRTLALVVLEEPDGGEREMDAARAAYESSLRLDPGQPLARLELAGVLVRLGRYAEADRQLALCRGLAPEADRADLLAQSAWQRGERGRCRALVEAGLKASPDHPGLLARCALIDQSEGRLEDAVAGFGRAATLDPYNPQWFHMRGVALRALGRRGEADLDAARSAKLKGAVVAMSDLCDEAARRPTDPAVRVRLGRLCETLGKPQLAASWYRAALACEPRNEEARSALAALPTR
jgi:tetratricopeptide (TPR) repeat protein